MGDILSDPMYALYGIAAVVAWLVIGEFVAITYSAIAKVKPLSGMIIIQVIKYIVTSRNEHWIVFYGVPILACSIILAAGGIIALLLGLAGTILSKAHNLGVKMLGNLQTEI